MDGNNFDGVDSESDSGENDVLKVYEVVDYFGSDKEKDKVNKGVRLFCEERRIAKVFSWLMVLEEGICEKDGKVICTSDVRDTIDSGAPIQEVLELVEKVYQKYKESDEREDFELKSETDLSSANVLFEKGLCDTLKYLIANCDKSNEWHQKLVDECVSMYKKLKKCNVWDKIYWIARRIVVANSGNTGAYLFSEFVELSNIELDFKCPKLNSTKKITKITHENSLSGYRGEHVNFSEWISKMNKYKQCRDELKNKKHDGYKYILKVNGCDKLKDNEKKKYDIKGGDYLKVEYNYMGSSLCQHSELNDNEVRNMIDGLLSLIGMGFSYNDMKIEQFMRNRKSSKVVLCDIESILLSPGVARDVYKKRLSKDYSSLRELVDIKDIEMAMDAILLIQIFSKHASKKDYWILALNKLNEKLPKNLGEVLDFFHLWKG